MRRITVIILLAAVCLCASANDSIKSPKRFIPTLNGTFRAFFEQSTADGSDRFIVRNARLSASGEVLPILDYFVQVDFCAGGKFTVLDAFARLKFNSLNITVGQSRVPFGAGASRAPANYYFLNRSSVARYTGDLRSVGVKAQYTEPGTALSFEGGVFNASANSEQSTWNSHGFTYSIRANYKFPIGLTPQIAFMSRRPSTQPAAARFNMLDASLTFAKGRWFAEAEYMWLHCTGNFRNSCEYNLMGSYAIPVRAGYFNQLSFQTRWDGMTSSTSGIPGEDGLQTANYHGYNRVTAGATFSAVYKVVHLDLRLNYEQYFYGHYKQAAANADNRLVAGLILYF